MNFNHLEETGENYLEHLWCTIKYSLLFVGLAMIILIHGLIPFILTTTASKKIKSLNDELTCRKSPQTHQTHDK